MRKAEFLSALRRALRGLPQRDIDGHVGFFEEIINDRVEDGLSEEQAVRSLGGVTKVYNFIGINITFLIIYSVVYNSLLKGIFSAV